MITGNPFDPRLERLERLNVGPLLKKPMPKTDLVKAIEAAMKISDTAE